jgi:hypothetical protein
MAELEEDGEESDKENCPGRPSKTSRESNGSQKESIINFFKSKGPEESKGREADLFIHPPSPFFRSQNQEETQRCRTINQRV